MYSMETTGNYTVLYTSKAAKRTHLERSHHKGKKIIVTMVMDGELIAVIISQYKHILSHYVNYISGFFFKGRSTQI